MIKENSDPTKVEDAEDKYHLAEEDIVELGEHSEFVERIPTALKALPWPMEIQGTGYTDRKARKFKVWYPEGDLFLSLSTTIHELGHLRQADIDPELDPEKDMGQDWVEHYRSNLAREKDAIGRGWERASRYCPDQMAAIEAKFQAAKAAGKFKDLESFEMFYRQVQEMMILINEFYKDFGLTQDPLIRKKLLADNTGIDNDKLDSLIKEAAGDYVAAMIKRAGKSSFFTEINRMRTGDKLKKEYARIFIRQAVARIIEEKY